MSDDPDETQETADARESRDLVFGALLDVAERAIAHADEHGLYLVSMEDRLDAPGFAWSLRATIGAGDTFVRLEAQPDHGDTARVVSMQEMARIMGNAQAAFACTIPAVWVGLAVAGRRPLLDAP